MTLPVSPRRPRRWGLYGPFIALAIAAAAWSVGWFWLRGEVVARLGSAAAGQARSGGALSWTGRRIYGYPFRLDVDFTGLVWRGPSGWAIAAPSLKTEAFVFAPGHWMAVAPAGVTVTRPRGGAIVISAKVLRASVSALAAHPARFSLEGLGLNFAPAPGAAPWLLDKADAVHLHTRAGPGGQGAFYVEIDKGTARPDGPLGRIAEGKPVNFMIDSIYSRADALKGPSWAGAVRSWAGAGGVAHVLRLRLGAGGAAIDARGEGLTVGDDGRLEGKLDATLSEAPRALADLAAAGFIDPRAAALAVAALAAERVGGQGHASLVFQAGRTTLGPVGLGPAPKVY